MTRSLQTLSKVFALVTMVAQHGCAAEVDGDEELDDLGAQEQALVGGTVTNSGRGEVGWYEGCTATLISRQHFITAAHCIDGNYSRVGSAAGIFSSPTTGALAVKRVYGFGSLDGPWDIAVGELTNPVAANLATPARLASDLPAKDTWLTAYGHGCSAYDNPNTPEDETVWPGRTRRSWRWDNPTSFTCSGDSGGPNFLGSSPGGDSIVTITSGGFEGGNDYRADVPQQKLRAEQQIREWNVDQLEPDVDRPGFDYSQVTKASAVACRDACETDAKCRAFTFVSSSAQCFLKSAIGERFIGTGVTSGIPRSTGLAIDHPGNDYKTIPSSSAIKCADECRADSICQAYAFVKSTSVCWLKSSVPATGGVVDSNVVAGVRRRFEENTDRPGADLEAATTVADANACATKCEKRSGCQAFSFVKSSKACFLKKHPVEGFPNTNVTSGRRRGWELNISMTGSDIATHNMVNPDLARCQSLCESHVNCKAWTLRPWKAGNAPGVLNTCQLKDAVPFRSASTGIISGVKGGSFF